MTSDPRHIDTSVAHSARVHDYWLGGKDNYAADRAAGDAVMAAYPGIVESPNTSLVSVAVRAASACRFGDSANGANGMLLRGRWRHWQTAAGRWLRPPRACAPGSCDAEAAAGTRIPLS